MRWETLDLQASALVGCLLSFMTITGCEEGSLPPPAQTGPPLIPIATGNRWTYVDSTSISSMSAADTFTVSVGSFRSDSLFTWWQIHDSRIPSTYSAEFGVRNDSIFSLQYNEDRAVTSLEYIPPAVAETLHYTSLFGGDVLLEKIVYPISGNCIVPAGLFNGCAEYVWLNSPLEFVETIKPGVGVVKIGFTNGDSTHHISLMEYHIVAPDP